MITEINALIYLWVYITCMIPAAFIVALLFRDDWSPLLILFWPIIPIALIGKLFAKAILFAAQEGYKLRDRIFAYFIRPADMTRILKWAWQRLTRGWDDRIIWSIDSYLAEMMPIWLRKLKADKQGVPNIFFEPLMQVGTDVEIAEAEAKWNAVLDEMIVGFEAAARIIDHKQRSGDKKLADRAFVLTRRYFYDLWW